MNTLKLASLLFVSAVGLSAQQQNMIFTTGAAPGLPGMLPGVLGAETVAFVSGELVGGNPVKGAPYSGNAVTENTQTLADGNHIVNRNTALIYRDGEGRQRREQSLPNIGSFAAQGTPPTAIFISDPVAGVHYSLNPNDKTAIKLPIPQTTAVAPLQSGAQPHIMVQRIGIAGGSASVSMVPPMGAPVIIYKSATGSGANSPTVEQLGTKVVEGVQAEGTRTTLTIPAGQIGNDQPIQIVDEVWRSPELQVIVHSEHSDPRMGSTTYSLQNISRSDPSPTLFQVPADYTIKDSAAFQRALPPPQ